MKYLIILFFIFTAQAKTLVISDIDDTLKISHVLNLGDALSNAYRTKNVFNDMAKVFHSIAKSDETVFGYVSNAPHFALYKSHKKLLTGESFPRGTLHLHKLKTKKEEHKIKAISQLIDAHRPDKILLFGDNGEKDIHFYREVKKKYPGVEAKVFIRHVYDENKISYQQDEYPFVTPVEVYSSLEAAKILATNITEDYLRNSLQKIYLSSYQPRNKGRSYFTKWQRCRSFQSLEIENVDESLKISYEKLIARFCENK
jgi:hypothetical protein